MSSGCVMGKKSTAVLLFGPGFGVGSRATMLDVVERLCYDKKHMDTAVKHWRFFGLEVEFTYDEEHPMFSYYEVKRMPGEEVADDRADEH